MKLLVDMRYACNHFPGIGRMSNALCHAFATHPDITHLTVLHNKHSINTRFTLPAPNAHVRHMALTATPFSVSEAWQIARAISHTTPDWVYTPYIRLPMVPLQRKLLVTIHDAIPFGVASPWWVRLGLRLAWLDACLRATALTTVSANAAQQIAHHLWPMRPMQVIPNGIDERFFVPAPPLDRQRLGIHDRFDLCVSSNQPHKNLATLLAAWANAYTQAPPATARQLIIAGQFDSTRTQPWHDTAYRHLPIVVIPSPSDDTLHALYQHAELFVYPSLAEGFGLPVAEAMASGCAIICHDHPAMRALVARDAWVIDMHDEALLSQTLTDAWHNHTQRQRYADAVRQHATQLRWHVAADAYVQVMHAHQ